MSQVPFDLTTLMPKETSFQLSSFKDKKFTLCRWSLRVRAWASEKYTSEGLKDIFEKLKIVEIADLVWYMLKDEDKAFFNKDSNFFLEQVVTTGDQLQLINALLGAVGIGEPEIKQIKQSLAPTEKKSPVATKKKKTLGSKFSTR